MNHRLRPASDADKAFLYALHPRALHLSERLGFYLTGVDGPFIRMRHDPTEASASRLG